MTNSSPNLEQILKEKKVITFENRVLEGFSRPIPLSFFPKHLVKEKDVVDEVIMKMIPEVPHHVTAIAGFGKPGMILAEHLANHLQKTCLPIKYDSYMGGLEDFKKKGELKGQKVVLIIDELTTGAECRNHIELIRTAKEIEKIIAVVDYGIKLHAESLHKMVKVRSCVSLRSIADRNTTDDSIKLLKWINRNPSLLRPAPVYSV